MLPPRLFTALCVTFLLLSGCDGGSRPLARQAFTEGTVLATETTADAGHVLVSTGPGPVRVWRRGEAEPRYHWYQGESTDDILLLASSPGSDVAATATTDTLALWSLDDGRNLGFYRLEQTLRALALEDGGRGLLLGYQSGEVEYVDLTSGRRLRFLGHQDRIDAVDLSANGRYALSASHDGEVIFWQTDNAAILARWRHEHSASLVRLDPQGGYAFSADAQGSGDIRRLPGGERQARLHSAHRGQTFVSARLDVTGNRLLTGGTARRLDLWQLDDGRLLNSWQVGLHTRLRPASAMVYSVAFIDSRQAYSVSSAGLGETWPLNHRDDDNE